MNWLSRLFRRATLERDLAREIDFHVDSAAEDLMRAGYPSHEARRLARLELGGSEQTKEATRDARGTRWAEDWWSDTRYAVRTMTRTPGFAIASVLTLGLGIGANTAIWSITDALMRRPLPVERPHELHAVHRIGSDEPNYRMSHPLMLRMRSTMNGVAQIAAMGSIARAYATIAERPDALLFQLVSGNFFAVLGVHPAAGRLLELADDETIGGGPVAVISDAFWESRFSRDPSVIGRSIRVNGVDFTVVGVTPAGFNGLTVGTQVSMYLPLVMQHNVRYSTSVASFNADPSKPWIPQRGVSWLTLIARVDPTHVREATAGLETVFRSELRETLAERDEAARQSGMKEHIELEPIARGFSPLREQFADPATCPENLLLWFHHLAWDHLIPSSGRTLWDELCHRYSRGVEAVRGMHATWNAVAPFVDRARHEHVGQLLAIQEQEARWWRSACLLYFQTFSRRPLPSDLEPLEGTLDAYRAVRA